MNRPNQIIFIVLLSTAILGFGTTGYMVFENWNLLDALYMTVITLATVGYGEVHNVSPAGRIFTIFLIFTGVGLFVYVGGNTIQFLVEGRIRAILGRRKLDRGISHLKGHFIVCGYGRIGRELCKYLTQRKVKLVVIDKDPDLIEVMNRDNVLYLPAEATAESSLLKAGIQTAKGLVTALGTDADNVFLVLTSKQLNPNLFVVARAMQNSTKKLLSAAGADKVVSPYDLGARRMAHAILRPTVIHFLELAFADHDTDILLEDIPIKASSPLADKTLMESGIRRDLDLIIIAMRHADGSMHFNPSADTRLEANQTVVAVGQKRNMRKLEALLNS